MNSVELDQYIREHLRDDRGWNWRKWDESLHYRGTYVKYDQQLLDLEAMYGAKLARLMEALRSYEQGTFLLREKEYSNLVNRLMRITAKYRNVKAEIEGRRKGFLKRDPIGTEYYIDLDAGNDGNTGLTTGQAWLTLEKYTSLTVRTVGDIAWVRANTSELHAGVADIVFDEDGSEVDRIYIIGCSSQSGRDPWGDASDTKPLLDFNDGAFCMQLLYDNFWQIENLEIIQGADVYGIIDIYICTGQYFKDLLVRDNSHGTGVGIYFRQGGFGIIDGCEFKDNNYAGVRCNYGGVTFIKNGIFNGGSGAGTERGVAITLGSYAEIMDSEFGQASSHTTNDIFVQNSIVRTRNVKVNNATPSFAGDWGTVYSEDYDGNLGDQRIFSAGGTISKETGAIRTGGADSHAKLAPNLDGGKIQYLSFTDFMFFPEPYRIWCQGGQAKTITFYCDTDVAWTSYPTVDEFYFEASYLSGSSGLATRSTVRSTQVFTDPNLTTFTLSFTPTQEGWVYINAFLKKYEASKYVRIDVRPDF